MAEIGDIKSSANRGDELPEHDERKLKDACNTTGYYGSDAKRAREAYVKAHPDRKGSVGL